MLSVVDFLEEFGVRVVKESKSGFSSLSHCPFCQKPGKSGVILDKKNHGYYNCFSGSCDTKGTFPYIYSLLKNVDYNQAKEEIYGKSSTDNKRVNLEFVGSKNTTEEIQPREDNPYFLSIEKGDFAWNYLSGRGYTDQQIEMYEILKVAENRSLFWESVKDKLSPAAKSAISSITRGFDKFPLLDECVDLLSSQYDLVDIQEAYFVAEAGRLVGRVIVPERLGGMMYGYMARSTSGDLAPKNINSSGKFSSYILGGFDRVKNLDRIIINEGFFDSVSCGPEACYLHGKAINKSSPKIDLLKLLSPDTTVIYLDVGAEADSISLWEELCLYHSKVVIVSPPEMMKTSRFSDEEVSSLIESGLVKEDGEYLLVPFVVCAAATCLKNESRGVKGYLKKMGRSIAFEQKVRAIQIKLAGITTSFGCDDMLSKLAASGYADADDHGLEKNMGIIDETISNFDILGYKKRHGFI